MIMNESQKALNKKRMAELVALRKTRGIPCGAVSGEMGGNYSHVASVERGQANATDAFIERYKAALGALLNASTASP